MKNRSVRKSLENVWSNKILLLLIVSLLIAIVVLPSPDPVGRGILVSTITLLLVKAEARSHQPLMVVLLGFLVASTSLIAAMNHTSVGRIFDWTTAILFLPLVFSKWLFADGSAVS